jgi:hypothetical protein
MGWASSRYVSVIDVSAVIELRDVQDALLAVPVDDRLVVADPNPVVVAGAQPLQVTVGPLAGVAELLFHPLASVRREFLESVANADGEPDLGHGRSDILEADGLAALNLLPPALDIFSSVG